MSLPSGLPSYEFRRTLAPSHDLSKYFHLRIERDAGGVPKLLPEGESPYHPLDLPTFFGKPEIGPIEIEIGCGKGGFMVQYCEKHPEIPFLGLEWEPEIAYLAAGRVAKRSALPYARVLLGDAFFFFRDFLPTDCVGAFHMYFPDPWPKTRQKKNRLMKAAFMEQVRRVGTDRALFFWGTDHEEYNAESRELFKSLPWLRLIDGDAQPTEGIITNFERKYRAQGKPIYRSVFMLCK